MISLLRTIPLLLVVFIASSLQSHAALPPGWADQDIGSVGIAGSASYVPSTGVFTLSGSGGDIAGTADAFNYAYESVTGNFIFTARITSNSGTNVNGGAPDGIMIRESLAANAREEMVYMQPGGPRPFSQWRGTTGGGTVRESNSDTGTPYPAWLKLERYGDEITQFYSYDGATWIFAQSCALSNLSQSLYIGITATARDNSALNTVTYDSVGLSTLNVSTVTSWLGNTFAGGGKYVQYGGLALAVNPSTGSVFVNGVCEDQATSFYDTNGNWLTAAENSHYNGSNAIAWDSTDNYVWVGQASYGYGNGQGKGGVAYYTIDGIYHGAVLNTSTTGQTIVGVAITGGNLYAVDSVNTLNSTTGLVTVHVVSLATKTENTSLDFNVPTGAQNVAADASGNLWIVFTGTTPSVGHYTSSGAYLGALTLTGTGNPGLANPQGIAIDSSGNIYVADNGVNQQIQVFTSAGVYSRSFGAQYGVYSTSNSTTVGQVDPSKLDHPVGIAIDNAGNLYVTCNGPYSPWYGDTGMVMRKYTSTTTASAATMAWERDGIEAVECASADPTDNGVDVYTKNHHYVVDYSQPPGQGWTYKGELIDDFAYPADPRVTSARAAAWVRVINGKKYLIDTDQQGSAINFYRFQANSEVTVPYASFKREDNRYGTPNNLSIWVDSNLDGVVDTGDVVDTNGTALGEPSGETFDWQVDANGDVWSMGGQNNKVNGVAQPCQIWHFKMTLDGNGNPTWSSANNEQFALPTQFESPYVLRTYYIPSTDTMYLAGYTTANPRPTGEGFGYVGTEIIRYNNWHTTQTLAFRTVVPFPQPSAGTASTDGTRAMALTGNLLATVMWGQTTNHQVTLYDATTGTLLDQFTPGPEVGGTSGNIDMNDGISLYQRQNGEYLIFVEEDNQEKVLMYRWTSPSSATTTVSFATTNDVGLTATSFNATGQTLNASLSYAPAPGTVLTVINNTGSSPITGTFTNLPNGGTLDLIYNGTTYAFTANYAGGDGNDLTLTYSPAINTDTPTMPLWALALLAALLLAAGMALQRGSTSLS